MKVLNFLAISLIKTFQYTVGLIFPNSCRFYPSCSNYALEVFKNHRFYNAMYYTIKRVLRCNPFCPGGYDPAPKRKD